MGGVGARFMWDLLAVRKRAEGLEDRYSLVVRELHAQSEGEMMARVASFQELERRYIPGSDDRLRSSHGFTEEERRAA